MLDSSRLMYDTAYTLGKLLSTYKSEDVSFAETNLTQLIQTVSFSGATGQVRFSSHQSRVPALELVNFQYRSKSKALARVSVGTFESGKSLVMNPKASIIWQGGANAIPNQKVDEGGIAAGRLMTGAFVLFAAASMVGAVWILRSQSHANEASSDARKASSRLSALPNPAAVKLHLCASLEKQHTLYRDIFFLAVHVGLEGLNLLLEVICYAIILTTVNDGTFYLVIYSLLCGVDLVLVPMTVIPWISLLKVRKAEYNATALSKISSKKKVIFPSESDMKQVKTHQLRSKTMLTEASALTLKLHKNKREQHDVLLSLYKCLAQQFPLLLCNLVYAYHINDFSYRQVFLLFSSAVSALALGFKCHLLDRYVRLKTDYNIVTYELALLTMLSNQRRSSYN